jgi:hypothetical protein
LIVQPKTSKIKFINSISYTQFHLHLFYEDCSCYLKLEWQKIS